jgi:hypothetical protein
VQSQEPSKQPAAKIGGAGCVSLQHTLLRTALLLLPLAWYY